MSEVPLYKERCRASREAGSSFEVGVSGCGGTV